MAADRPILLVEHDPNNPPGTLIDWFDEMRVAHETLRPHAGDAFPADGSAYAATIMLGGAPSVNSTDGFAWRDDTIAFIQRAVADEHPMLCLCLSSQVLAYAMGGRVERGAHGREVGAMLAGRKDVSYSDELFSVLPMAPDVIEFHGEAITALPPGAVHLMGGPVYDNQAFRVGSRAWGMQFHIETTPAMFAHWAELARPSLERKGMDVDLLIERATAVHPDLEEVWKPFVRRFAEIAGVA